MTSKSPEPVSEKKSARQRFGASGERLATHWLEQQGYRIVARNWHCAYGELDIVAEYGGEVIFVEVKARRGDAMGTPEEAVTPAKQRRLILSAQSFLAERGEEQRLYRIDVITVAVSPAGRLLTIQHYPGCVEAE